MAKLYYSEYSVVGAFETPAQMALEPSIEAKVVDFSSGEAKSGAFNVRTRFVRVWADADCCLAFGTNPTADENSLPVAAKAPEYFGVAPGDKLSAIGMD